MIWTNSPSYSKANRAKEVNECLLKAKWVPSFLDTHLTIAFSKSRLSQLGGFEIDP